MGRARLIDVIPLPVALTDFGGLSKAYPKGSTISQQGANMWVRSAGDLCFGCITCASEDAEDYKRLTGDWLLRTFIVCPDCGCKRCPKATQHDLACTGSNEPGQEGSVYA